MDDKMNKNEQSKIYNIINLNCWRCLIDKGDEIVNDREN